VASLSERISAALIVVSVIVVALLAVIGTFSSDTAFTLFLVVTGVGSLLTHWLGRRARAT
jgi:hypothetical protein